MNRSVFRHVDWLGFMFLSAANIGVALWAASRLIDIADVPNNPISLLVLVPVALALLSFEARWFTLPLMRVPAPSIPTTDRRVGVVTTFVPGLEPITMLERTVRALVAMDHPHDTWVLDEGDDPEVRDLCVALGAHHFTRKGRERYQQPSGTFEAKSKHGNYNAWLDAIAYDRYDVIAAFDPDHVPKPEFLDRLVGYFDDDEVGYVQAPQLYYNQSASFIARGAAEETYAYYSSIQMTSYALGYPIVTGCHNVHRTVALREVGGFAPHEADDLLITVLYRAAGWRGVYVPEELASGITPVDWRGYLIQQRRWARSVLDVKLRIFPRVARDLPLVERVVAALHGLYYLHGLSTAISVGFLAMSLAIGHAPPIVSEATAGTLAVLWGVLFGCELFRQRFYLKRSIEWGIHLRAALLKFAKWPYVLLALRDALSPPRGPYAITAKVRVAGGRMLLRAHGTAIAIVVVAWLVGVAHGGVEGAPLIAGAIVYLAMSALVVASEWLPTPSPYDDDLAAAQMPWSRFLHERVS